MRSTERVGTAVTVLLTLGLAATGLLPAVVVVLSLPFLALCARRPVVRRFAVRNAARRPRETAFVLLGSMLGTAVITGSFIVGDTLDSSLRRSAFTQLGPVDMVVRTEDDAPEQRAALEHALAGLPPELTDGVLPLVTTSAVVARSGPKPRAEPKATVLEADFGRARAFGGDQSATGIKGRTPGPGEAAVGADLASTLHVGVGDRIEAYAYGGTIPLRVVRVLPRRGLAGLQLGFGSRSPTVFVHPGTLHEAARNAAGRNAAAPGRPPAFLVAVSNRGGVIEGAALSERVERAITAATAGLGTGVVAVKQDALDFAAQAGEEFTALFAALSFFSVLAGVVLLVNVMAMLAQGRKTELGMLRALGLRRAGLVACFALEGWLYALAASAFGVIAGLGVGRVVVVAAARVFGEGEFAIDLHYAAELGSVQAGFTVGFVVSLLTVVAASVSVARLNVIRAIRDLPVPPRRAGRASIVLALAAAAGGGALAMAGITGPVAALVLVGPAMSVVGIGLLLARRLPSRPVVTTVGLGVIAWGVVAFEVFPRAFRDADVVTFVVQGVMLTAAAVALAARNQDVLGSALARLRGRTPSTAVRLGLAYPLARRLRTSLLLAMYALVMFTLTFVTIISHVFSTQVDDLARRTGGGFDLRMETSASNPVTPDVLRSTPGVERVAPLATVAAEFEAPSTEGFEPWPVAGFDETLLEGGPVALAKRSSGYGDDQAVYRAALADASLAVVDGSFLQSAGAATGSALGPGDHVAMRDPRSGRVRTLTIVGVTEATAGSPLAYISRGAMQAVFGSAVTTDTFLLQAQDNVDPDRLASALNSRFALNGADAKSFRRIVDETLSQQRQFFRLMQGYLALGLVVGVAGLAVVMVRAVHERRRQIGTLRALGFQPASVQRAFMLESSFIALQGITIGVVLASMTAWRLAADGDSGTGPAFSLPWLSLTLLATATYAASLLATVLPARQASRIRPALSLRAAD